MEVRKGQGTLSSGVFHKLTEKSRKTRYLGVFRVARLRFDIGTFPQRTWSVLPGYTHDLLWIYWNNLSNRVKLGTRVFSGQSSRIWHRHLFPGDLVRATWLYTSSRRWCIWPGRTRQVLQEKMSMSNPWRATGKTSEVTSFSWFFGNFMENSSRRRFFMFY